MRGKGCGEKQEVDGDNDGGEAHVSQPRISMRLNMACSVSETVGPNHMKVRNFSPGLKERLVNSLCRIVRFSYCRI